jgi:dihydroorotase
MSSKPADIARYADHGSLEVGTRANFFLADLDQEWTVDRAALHSKSRNTPFHAMRLPARIMMTFHNGALVFDRGAH